MITDDEYTAWLSDPSAIRVVLFEAVASVSGVETTRYMSIEGFVTTSTDTPANTVYESVVCGGLQITESISLSADASMSVGDVEIYNYAGERDSWLNDVWVNRSFKAFIGDARWTRADFRTIFNGISAGINSKSRDKLNISLRDKLQRLNTPLSEATLGGSTANANVLIPLAFGEVHNISPLLTNPVTLQYQVHNGACESIFEVRDNGKPVNATIHNSTGLFELLASPAGAVTVSMQGDKPSTYSNTISLLIQRIVTGYGKASDRFVSGDLDATNLSTFEAAHSQPVGLYLNSRTNVLAACQQLASSVGAQMVMTRTGLLQLIQITLPAIGTPTAIYEYHQVHKSLEIVNRTEVVAAVKLGYCQNYTVQPGLQTSIPAQHKDLFNTEWLTVTAADTAVQTNYKLNVEPVQKDTCLLVLSDAQTEATRQLNLTKVVRTTYRFEGTPAMLSLVLGQAVTLYSSRFGLSAGVLGMVTSLTPDWLNGHVTVEVLV